MSKRKCLICDGLGVRYNRYITKNPFDGNYEFRIDLSHADEAECEIQGIAIHYCPVCGRKLD